MWETSTSYALNREPERVGRSRCVGGREVRCSGGSASASASVAGTIGPSSTLALALTLRFLGRSNNLAQLVAMLGERLELGCLVVLLDEGNGALSTLAVESLLDLDRARATAGRDEEALGEVVLKVALARGSDALHARDAALATVDVLLQELCNTTASHPDEVKASATRQ